jgi:hypothetical protein
MNDGGVVVGLHNEVAAHLEQISKLFKKGAKLTLIIRHTAIENADVCIGDDDLELAFAAARKLMESNR